MPMTEYTGDTEIITKLGTTPAERGLETDEFKAKFDEGLKAFVTWFNDTHKTEFDAHLADIATDAELGHVKVPAENIDEEGLLIFPEPPSFRGALTVKSSNQSISSGTTIGANTCTFPAASYDTDNLWDGTSKFIIPAGITKVKALAIVRLASNNTGYRSASVYKNGANTYPGAVTLNAPAINGTDTRFAIQTAVIDVVAGDYLELKVQQNSGGSLDIVGDSYSTWFALEVIE